MLFENVKDAQVVALKWSPGSPADFEELVSVLSYKSESILKIYILKPWDPIPNDETNQIQIVIMMLISVTNDPTFNEKEHDDIQSNESWITPICIIKRESQKTGFKTKNECWKIHALVTFSSSRFLISFSAAALDSFTRFRREATVPASASLPARISSTTRSFCAVKSVRHSDNRLSSSSTQSSADHRPWPSLTNGIVTNSTENFQLEKLKETEKRTAMLTYALLKKIRRTRTHNPKRRVNPETTKLPLSTPFVVSKTIHWVI